MIGSDFFNVRRYLQLLFVLCVFLFVHYTATAASEPTAQKADEVLVLKSKRVMYLLRKGKILHQYDISLGDNPVGHKQQEGDERTPEGRYVIDYRNPRSSYHLSLHINYPNKNDRDAAHRRGVSPGGQIFIHGLPNGMAKTPWLFQGRDWTDGCIAVSSDEIEQIWKLVDNGTPIEIRP